MEVENTEGAKRSEQPEGLEASFSWYRGPKTVEGNIRVGGVIQPKDWVTREWTPKQSLGRSAEPAPLARRTSRRRCVST